MSVRGVRTRTPHRDMETKAHLEGLVILRHGSRSGRRLDPAL